LRWRGRGNGVIITPSMKRVIWQVMVVALFALRLPAQTALEFFTNQANALLQPAFGFGVANIPVYSSTSPAIAYSASLHYLLQSAANAYDATTPATNSPSVFRPLFAWSGNTLFIVGYTNVTTDFYTQTGPGFKALTDPTISSNDNVWGIPWVVGMKNNPPAFNEYCYSTSVLAERQLLFVRAPDSGGPPIAPIYTNQFFCLAISNIFGIEAWNYSPSNYPDPVTIVASNQVSLTITNNYDGGTNITFSESTNWIIESWPGWSGGPSGPSFLVPMFTNLTSLAESYWSDSTEQFVSFSSTNPEDDIFLPSDLTQTGWPEYDWTLNITNNLMYALIDNRTGLVLDFVNLGGFGSSLPITQELVDQLSLNDAPLLWSTNGATDEPNSPMSSGVSYQILSGVEEYPAFYEALRGGPTLPGPIFGDPDVPTNEILQNCSWQAFNPRVHYTVDDLSLPDNEEIDVSTGFPESVFASTISNSICTLGKINEYYDSERIENLVFGLPAGTFQLNFLGVYDLPYAIWASTNMLDWSQVGAAVELYPNQEQPPDGTSFQFNDLGTSNYPARFFQVRLP
jgi:hypothetical protein